MKRKEIPEVEEQEEAAAEEEEAAEEEGDGVISEEVIVGCKHGDGSIYRLKGHRLQRMYRFDDSRETRLEPMRLSLPTKKCFPSFTNCLQHITGGMLQIYSLKLNLPEPDGSSPVRLYGFMAARDYLDPLRNYIFNRSQDDPFIIEDMRSDPFIYLCGPKRGVYFECPVVIEYDMRIKKGEREEDDLPLIDGMFVCSELDYFRGPFTRRVGGEFRGASVDVSRAMFRESVEATVEVRIFGLASEREDLTVSGFVPPVREEIKLFRGVIDRPCALNRFVVAVILNSFLVLSFKVPGAAPNCSAKLEFRAVTHGSICSQQTFSFATVEVKVTWSGLC